MLSLGDLEFLWDHIVLHLELCALSPFPFCLCGVCGGGEIHPSCVKELQRDTGTYIATIQNLTDVSPRQSSLHKSLKFYLQVL